VGGGGVGSGSGKIIGKGKKKMGNFVPPQTENRSSCFLFFSPSQGYKYIKNFAILSPFRLFKCSSKEIFFFRFKPSMEGEALIF
jgi:hypothetical protein